MRFTFKNPQISRRRTILSCLPSSSAVLPLQIHVLVRRRRNFWAYCPDLAKSHITDSVDLLTRRIFDKGGIRLQTGVIFSTNICFIFEFLRSNSVQFMGFPLSAPVRQSYLILRPNSVPHRWAVLSWLGRLLVLLMVLFVAALSSPFIRGQRGFVYVFSYLR